VFALIGPMAVMVSSTPNRWLLLAAIAPYRRNPRQARGIRAAETDWMITDPVAVSELGLEYAPEVEYDKRFLTRRNVGDLEVTKLTAWIGDNQSIGATNAFVQGCCVLYRMVENAARVVHSVKIKNQHAALVLSHFLRDDEALRVFDNIGVGLVGHPELHRMNFVNAELTKISVNTFVTTDG